MKEVNEWDFDLDWNSINQFTGDYICTGDFHGSKDADVGSITKKIKKNGIAFLEYRNCWNSGYVVLILNGNEIDKVGPQTVKEARFEVQSGDRLGLKVYEDAVVELNRFTICITSSMFCISRNQTW